MPTTTRKLAAIMFTDIVGYTALMGSDEDKAFEVLRKNREIHTKNIAQFNGTLIKEMGDGVMAQFGSASDSVQCAMEIQRQARKELDAQIRIGIHLGDITFENNDVFGDGVNIASRLQSNADPGGIYISESLQKSIRAKCDIKTKYLGEFKLKNVGEPVRTHVITGNGLSIPSKAKIRSLMGKSLQQKIMGSIYTYFVAFVLLMIGFWFIRKNHNIQQSDITPLLVLPVDNYVGTDTLDYLAAGIHSSLISDLGRISELRIPSQTTARAYKASGKSLKDISEELKVNYAIEPSIICMGDTVCLKARLMRIGSEEQLIWNRDYLVERTQIQNFYSQLTREISEAVNIKLKEREEEMLSVDRTVNKEANDYYNRGLFYLQQINDASLKTAIKYFRLAIEKDPDWADPYAGLAEVGTYQSQMGFLPYEQVVPFMRENLEIAIRLDPNASYPHYVGGVVAAWTDWDWEKAEQEFLKALELNPSNAMCRIFYAHFLMNQRRYNEAFEQGRQAVELDRLNPFILALYARVWKYAEKDYEKFRYYTDKALEIDPNHRFARGALRDIYVHYGEYDNWLEEWKKSAWWGKDTIAEIEKVYQIKGYIPAIKAIIKVNEDVYCSGGRISFLEQASRYFEVEDYEKVLDYYEKAYENHSPSLPYITGWRSAEVLKNYPRYQALLKKMNLPYN